MCEPLRVRRAEQAETDAACAFYGAVIDGFAGAPFDPLWRRGVYPTREMISRAVENDELYFGECGEKICAAMVLNRTQDDGWEGAPWAVPAGPDERLVLHLLAVDPARQGQGLARRMVRAAVGLAREQGAKALRLDVLPKNLPAVRCYEREGFRFIARLTLFYEDTGSVPFDLYELPL